MRGLVARGGPLAEPPAHLSYAQALRGPGFLPVRGWFGVAVALFAYALSIPLINQMLLALFWIIAGRGGTFAEFFARAQAYDTPLGLVASHLALGCLILISVLMVIGWHRRRPEFLASVQPGMRWRYLLLCLPVAAIILNAIYWLGQAGNLPLFSAPPRWWWWVAAIVVFAPLQAAGEEYFFRGYMMQAFGSALDNRWLGVVLSALVFAFFHGVQNLWLFLDRLGFGLIAGALVVCTGGLEAAIAAHVANNLFAFGYAVFSGGVAQTRAVQSIGPAQLLSDLVAFTLIALATWGLGRLLRVARTTPAPASPVGA